MQPQSAQVDLVTVMQPRVRKLAMASGRCQHLCSAGGPELVCAGKEIGMQVGVGGERHRQPTPGRGRAHRAQITAHVNNQGPPVTQIDQISRVAQALIDQRNQIKSSHRMSPFTRTAASCPPMFYTIPKMIGECYG